MLQRQDDGTIVQVSTTTTVVTREDISNCVDMLSQEVASVTDHLNQKQSELASAQADLAQFDQLSAEPTAPVENPAPAEETPSVDELISETPEQEAAEDAPTPVVEAPQPEAAPTDNISVEQAVDQGVTPQA